MIKRNNNLSNEMGEYSLRRNLFSNYSVNNIPIVNSSDHILLKYGIPKTKENFFID